MTHIICINLFIFVEIDAPDVFENFTFLTLLEVSGLKPAGELADADWNGKWQFVC